MVTFVPGHSRPGGPTIVASGLQPLATFVGFNVAGSLGFLLGPLIAGVAYQLMVSMGFSALGGFRMAFLVAGAGEVVCALITLPLLRDLARRGALKAG